MDSVTLLHARNAAGYWSWPFAFIQCRSCTYTPPHTCTSMLHATMPTTVFKNSENLTFLHLL
jgi:hypothetical protein